MLLMKDFVIHPSQIEAAQKCGADLVLLIVRILDSVQLKEYFDQVQSLGLQALVEVHNSQELEVALRIGARLIGVNNRDLDSLKVDLKTSRNIRKSDLPSETVLISESGLQNANQIMQLRELGYQGFLMGTHLMRSKDPGQVLRNLCEELE